MDRLITTHFCTCWYFFTFFIKSLLLSAALLLLIPFRQQTTEYTKAPRTYGIDAGCHHRRHQCWRHAVAGSRGRAIGREQGTGAGAGVRREGCMMVGRPAFYLQMHADKEELGAREVGDMRKVFVLGKAL
jgi:hypothetical protein